MRCLVVGGTRGIGKAVAQALRDRGEEVLTASREGADVDLDLSDPTSEIEASMSQALVMLGGIDRLILSAGMGAYTLPKYYDNGRARKIMAVNFHGRLACLEACYSQLSASQGLALFITSTAGANAPPGLPIYSASHAACEAFVRSEGRRVEDRFVIAALAPAWTETDMTAELDPAIRAAAEAWMPIGRFLTPEEVAAKVMSTVFDAGEVIAYAGEDLVQKEA